MSGCRKINGLIAASLYESLPTLEQAQLDTHLKDCSLCRTETEMLRRLVTKLPNTPVVFKGDLLPAIRRRLPQEGTRPSWARWRWAAPAAGCMSVLLLIGYIFVTDDEQNTSDRILIERIVLSPLGKGLEIANALIAKRDYAGAIQVLSEALRANPSDRLAGETLLLLANLHYTHLQGYSKAYSAYEDLREAYPDAWNGSAGWVKDRFDLLAESREANFESLLALDAARSGTGDSFFQLERIIAENEGKLVSWKAVTALYALERKFNLDDGISKAEALMLVKNKCTNPVAVAQLKMALGNTYWEDLYNPTTAAAFYTEVAESGHSVLASLAQKKLSELRSEIQR